MANYEEQQQVRIEGEVRYPGNYAIKHQGERISDLIQRAGGLTKAAYVIGASLKRPDDAGEEANPHAIDVSEEEQEKVKNLACIQKDVTEDEVNVSNVEVEILGSELVG